MANGSYNLSVKVIGAKELEQALASVDEFAKNAIMVAIDKTAVEVERRARLNAPHDKGALWGSLHIGGKGNTSVAAHVTGNNIEAKVGTNLNYAKYQELGTGLYGPNKTLIKPKNAKAMIMTDRSGNVTGWFKSSKGVHPKYFFKKAVASIKSDGVMTKNMQEALKKIVDHLSTK